MKRSSCLTLIALALAAIGVVIGLAAYFKNRSQYLYDDDDLFFDDPDDLEFYPDLEDETPETEATDGDELKF